MFAHSIKNPGIKHYFLRESRRGYDYEGNYGKDYRRFAYLCMSASNTTPNKRTRVILEVTCFNCLRELKKRMVG